MSPQRETPQVYRPRHSPHYPISSFPYYLTTHHSPLTPHHSPLTTHHSPLLRSPQRRQLIRGRLNRQRLPSDQHIARRPVQQQIDKGVEKIVFRPVRECPQHDVEGLVRFERVKYPLLHVPD